MRTNRSDIAVLLYQIGEAPRPKFIPNTLEAMQELVGGYIETVTLEDGLILVCNEEGRMNGLPPNASVTTRYGQQYIYGDFFICRGEGDEFSGLHNSQEMLDAMDYVTERYKPEKRKL
ncbi:MAG TPA: DUF3846 domain-containing protein [Oscillospiraceae bacterium]|nr:DUF3846 domain-containing protein [Oscillospiraceae bacterium]HRW57807.1 DUF3846 domain-containing protein [Oscillospiraceae bacterium]